VAGPVKETIYQPMPKFAVLANRNSTVKVK